MKIGDESSVIFMCILLNGILLMKKNIILILLSMHFSTEKSLWLIKTAYSFTLDSGSELGLGSGLAARSARKMAILNSKQIKEWSHMSKYVMESAARAKYKECKLAQKILKSTKNAELWHHVTRSKPDRFIHLELNDMKDVR